MLNSAVPYRAMALSEGAAKILTTFLLRESLDAVSLIVAFRMIAT
jgi:DNA-binding protein H-NS